MPTPTVKKEEKSVHHAARGGPSIGKTEPVKYEKRKTAGPGREKLRGSYGKK